MSSSLFTRTGARSTFACQRIRVNGWGALLATAVCCAFPPKPAHATAALAAPARELPASAICALAAVENSQELSTTTTAATAPFALPTDLPAVGRLVVLAESARSSRDRRGQPDMTLRPSRHRQDWPI